MSTVLVVAPHPDDETLGCAGALLRHKAEGDDVYWLIMTSMHERQGFSPEKIASRDAEIQEVSRQYGFNAVHTLNFPTTELDSCARHLLVAEMANVVESVEPNVMYLPYSQDIHSDHKVTFDVAAACTKSFRYPSIKSVRVYETLSETEQSVSPDDTGFKPNLFVDISAYLAKKIEIMQRYKGEMGEAPFPRSSEIIAAQAKLRGCVIGSTAAEAFMLVREII